MFTGKFLAADKPDLDHPDEQKLLAAAPVERTPTAVSEGPSTASPNNRDAQVAIAGKVPVFSSEPNHAYRVLVPVKAVAKQPMPYSKPITEQTAFDALAAEGAKIGADAIIRAKVGKQHLGGWNYKEAVVTGDAVIFTQPQTAVR